jgi:hypothetical protein
MVITLLPALVVTVMVLLPAVNPLTAPSPLLKSTVLLGKLVLNETPVGGIVVAIPSAVAGTGEKGVLIALDEDSDRLLRAGATGRTGHGSHLLRLQVVDQRINGTQGVGISLRLSQSNQTQPEENEDDGRNDQHFHEGETGLF